MPSPPSSSCPSLLLVLLVAAARVVRPVAVGHRRGPEPRLERVVVVVLVVLLLASSFFPVDDRRRCSIRSTTSSVGGRDVLVPRGRQRRRRRPDPRGRRAVPSERVAVAVAEPLLVVGQLGRVLRQREVGRGAGPGQQDQGAVVDPGGALLRRVQAQVDVLPSAEADADLVAGRGAGRGPLVLGDAAEARRAPGESLGLPPDGHDQLRQGHRGEARQQRLVPRDRKVCPGLGALALERGDVVGLCGFLFGGVPPEVGLLALVRDPDVGLPAVGFFFFFCEFLETKKKEKKNEK